MSNKLDKLINKKLFRKLLKEQEQDILNPDMSDYTSMGFKDVASNSEVIQMKDPQANNNKEIFKNSKIEQPAPNKPYFILKDFYKQLIKNNKLGSTGKELGISSDNDPYTYEDLGGGKYKVISGPEAKTIGNTFTPEKKKEPVKKDSEKKKEKYEFTKEQISKLPKDLNKEKGNMFRDWVNDNKTDEEIAEVFKDLPGTDKTLGRSGSFSNDHFKLAYITFKEEYEKHLKKFGTNNEPVLMGLKKAETGAGVNKDYYKLYIDDVAIAIDTDGNILQRPRGKGGDYVNERKIINKYRLLNERKLDVSYIIDKIQKGIESGSIKGIDKADTTFKDIIKKKAATVKKVSKSKSRKIKVDTSKVEKIFMDYAREEGFTPEDTPELLAAMMAVIDKESRWSPQAEKSYSGTSAVRIVGSELYLNRDGTPLSNPNPGGKKGYAGLSACFHLNIEQIDALKSSDEDFFSYIYGDGKERTVNGVFIPKAYTYNESPASNIAFRNKKMGASIEGRMYKDFVGNSKFARSLAKAQDAENKDAKLKNRDPETLTGYAPVFHHRLSHDVPEPDDGFKYRGHGLNQLTGKSQYQKYEKLGITGIVEDPTVLDEPDKASEVAALFLCRGIKKMLGLKGDDPASIGQQAREKCITPKMAVQAAAGVNAGKSSPDEKYAASRTQDGFDKYIQKFGENTALAENSYKTRNDKMIITESQLRSIIKKILSEATAKFDDHIKDRESGNDFRSWANKNHSDVTDKLDLDPKGSHTNTYIKSAWDELGDEYVKAKEADDQAKKAADQKKKRLSTGGKLVALKGQNSDGTYPAAPDMGLDNPYYKFILDTQAFAFDPSDPNSPLRQRERGSGEKFSIKSESVLFERVLGVKLSEKFINPGTILSKIKDGDVNDPKGVFQKNKEKIQNIATKVFDKVYSKKPKILDASEYEMQKSKDGAPNVPAVRKFVAAAKEEMGMVFNSLGRSAADQARISFQGPYANDALIRKIDPSIPPGTYYFSNHPKGKENLKKINAALKQLGKSSVSKGVYGAYGSSTYMPIFKNYEKALKDVQKVGATGKSALGDTGKSAWEATIPFWEKIAKSQKARGKKGHMTGYGIDIPRNTSKERLIQLNKIANQFGLRINTNTKPESDHFHLNIYELKPSDIEKMESDEKKDKPKVAESRNKKSARIMTNRKRYRRGKR